MPDPYLLADSVTWAMPPLSIEQYSAPEIEGLQQRPVKSLNLIVCLPYKLPCPPNNFNKIDAEDVFQLLHLCI